MKPTLTELVALAADEPSVTNRDAFYRALVSSQVFFPAQFPAGNQGTRVTQQGDNTGIPTAPGPDGATMLLVFADQASLVARLPSASYAGLDGRVLLRIAAANKLGVVVQCSHRGRVSWAGVPPDHVASILAEPPSQGS